ncbi:MAG: DNA cytosine methyltransferase, partial [Rhodococcus qingshengii]
MQKKQKWAAADLFSGCGGMSAGLASTGRFDNVYAADID